MQDLGPCHAPRAFAALTVSLEERFPLLVVGRGRFVAATTQRVTASATWHSLFEFSSRKSRSGLLPQAVPGSAPPGSAFGVLRRRANFGLCALLPLFLGQFGHACCPFGL
ncbi:hypothetical protein C5E45_16325 [Nocardia nova]|uniref:Uncharacterized protein n=1 Tax=Nocardia nova TaxID=37330 RepID=A0A2S6APQ1_9NOCA|nr:hypothetical protein C5E41_14520 [Nocardia nova]PPJ37215.1 hypothetical protein C5E45_16325 [Nocardia nova]